MLDNPFPAVMGRVCYRPCETACNRAQLDSAVGINSVERFLGDEALRRGWKAPVDAAPTGKRVLVVGAGPSGLSAAYHLTRLGHSVTIKDAGAAPGGMMRYGIPKYRLPRDILDAEMNRIVDMGVTLELNAKVTDILGELNEAAGGRAWGGRRLRRRLRGRRRPHRPPRLHPGRRLGPDPGRGVAAAWHGRRLCRPCSAAGSRSTAAGTPPWTRRAPRDGSARPRQSWSTAGPGTGCPRTTRRSTEALDEGVTMRWLSTISRADEGKLLIEKMQLDETGFPQPTGEFEELEADCLVLALGQNADLSVLEHVPGVTFCDNVTDVGPDLMTGHPGIFAGGDMVPSERTVTVAIGHGQKAARSIDAWLRGAAVTSPRPSTRSPRSAASTPGTTPTRRPPSGPRWRRPAGSPPSTRW